MKENDLRLLNYQQLASLLFIISIIISMILTYNEKKSLNNERIFSKNFERYLNLFNRILALGVTIFILYINIEYYDINKNKRSNIDPYRHQIYASLLSVISALIVLYVVIENWKSSPNITNI